MRPIKFASLSIAIILICSMLTTACNQGTETTPTPLPSAPSLPSLTPAHPSEYLDDPEAVTLVECQFYGDHQENLDWKEIWPRLVEDRYGVSITMVTPAREKYMETIEKAAKSGKLTGIVEIFGGPYLENWKSMDLIYPLTDYLAENEVWNTLIPEHWKTAFTIEGDVWAIPSGSDGNISWFARSIRGDWLDKFGLEKPYTLDEFYEASYNFTYKDPNDSGKDDTVGFTGSGLFSLADIFAAYNARLSPNSDTTLVWNPNSEVWEDSMVKPEMVECLEFLRKCFSDGILDQNCFSGLSSADIRQRISSGLYGGALYWDSWILSFESKVKELYPEAYLECVGALSHNIDTNLVRYSPVLGGAPKVMMKTTQQPKETINWYVNTFFGDDWGFWTGRLGPVGDYPGQDERACTIEDNKILRNTYIDHTGTIKVHPGPGFIGGLPSKALYTVYEVAYHVPSPPKGMETWAEDTAKRAMANTARRKSWIDEYIGNGMAYIIPEGLSEPISESYAENREDISKLAYETIKNAITGEMSIEDAIEHYKEMARSLGVWNIIDIENAKLDKVTEQDY